MLSKLSIIPFIGWVLAPIASGFIAIPFYVLWVWFGLADKFFYFVPQVYREVGFCETAGLFILISFFGNIIKMLSPFSVTPTIKVKSAVKSE